MRCMLFQLKLESNRFANVNPVMLFSNSLTQYANETIRKGKWQTFFDSPRIDPIRLSSGVINKLQAYIIHSKKKNIISVSLLSVVI